MHRTLQRPLPDPARFSRTLGFLLLLSLTLAMPVWSARIVVAGQVVDETGAPLNGAEVSLSATGAEPPLAMQTTEKEGKFELKFDGETGTYRLRVAAPGYGPLDQEVSLTAGTRTEASIPLLPAALASRQAAIDAYNEAVAALQAEDHETGRQKLGEAIAADPNLPEPHLVLAQLHLDAGDPEAAIPEIEHYLEARPDDEQARRVAYEAHRRAGNEEGMERHGVFLAETDAAPALAKDVYNRGVALHEEGDAEAALAQFRRALEIDPTLDPASIAIASLLSTRGEDEAALVALEPVLARNPDDAVALRARFIILDRNDDPRAESALDGWAAAAPEAAIAWLDERAEKDFEADRLDRARTNLARLLRLRPQEPEFHYRMGLVYAALSQPGDARRHLEKFVQLAPEHPEAGTARAMIDAL